ncbi:hypothetical protein L6452_01372 [Arctium lappa]|uniref:Uncharacterized protein n=1 Tax=Arctium lappa TaxID=4217 RepID=A0ACB9FHD9_ARCLA|nr:hypothetical protein L6452_01372 [Arctium lappa]
MGHGIGRAGGNMVRQPEFHGGRKTKLAPPPPPPPPLLSPPLPVPPPPLTMGLDVLDSRRAGSETSNPKNSGRPSQGTTSTGRHTNTSWSGNVGRERESQHHRRSGGDRYNSNSPRERSHYVEDSGGGYSRSSRTPRSWQSSSSSSSYSRPTAISKGQHVCKFYESERCKKG